MVKVKAELHLNLSMSLLAVRQGARQGAQQQHRKQLPQELQVHLKDGQSSVNKSPSNHLRLGAILSSGSLDGLIRLSGG